MNLAFLGHLAMARGDHALAAARLEEALAIFRELDHKVDLSLTLALLGRLAARQGDHGRATVLLEEGLAYAREGGAPPAIAGALLGRAEALRARGEHGQAARASREGLALASQAGDPVFAAAGLRGVAILAGARGQPKRAAKLFGAEAALREARAFALDPVEAAEQERAVAAVRAQLSGAAFAGAWAAGRALPPEEAVAEALALADELAGATPEPAASQAAERV